MAIEKAVYLNDIAGYREEKEEAAKLIDILSRFEEYKARGARVPKGLILCGDPGLGKTMLAKAIATESGVPFFELSGLDGPEDCACSILKDIFDKAKASAPSILFIDELDEIVTLNEMAFCYSGYQSDFSRKILKALLTEIDGLDGSNGVLVIATANKAHLLPEALLRSGRLEKQISFDKPDVQERKEIFELYLSKKGVVGVSAAELAKRTSGFSGSDIETLVNEAIICSVRDRIEIGTEVFETAIPVIRFGTIRKKKDVEPSPAVIYHEIGHFLCNYGLTGEVGAITVASYGKVEGYMELQEDPDGSEKGNNIPDAGKVLDSIVVSLGGIAGEEVFLGKRYCGSSSDIEQALYAAGRVLANGVLGFEYLPTLLSMRRLPRDYAMSDERNEGSVRRSHEKMIDLLNDGLKRAIKFVRNHKLLGDMIFPLLKEKRSLTKEDLSAIVDEYNGLHCHSAKIAENPGTV